MCRVLVTDGETRAALATVRALGRAGHVVHVSCARARSLAGASRYAAAEHALGDPALAPGDWVAALEELVERVRPELILPLTEVSLGTLYSFDVPARRPVACPSRHAYEAVTDKHDLLQRASGLGISVPRTLLVERPGALSDLPAPFRYPVILKPRRSRWIEDGSWRAGETQVVAGPEALGRVAASPVLARGALLQEYVPGHGEGLFLLASAGRTLVRFAHRRLREKPPTGGVSVLRESIEPDLSLLQASESLLRELGWTGVAMVEFRRRPNGEAVLMEVNPRLWGSLQLAIDAGVDFPSLLVALHRGETLPQVTPSIGVRSRWLLGDLDHLLISLRRPEVRRLTGRSVPGLLADFLRSFVDGSRPEVLRWDDWRPFLRELRDWLRG